MKKAILTIGLFTLVLASTSFAAPQNSNSSIADNTIVITANIDGGQSSGGNKKVDEYSGFNNADITSSNIDGGQSSGGNKKVDE